MGIQLYNTLTRRKEPLVPADPGRVTMYVCGPTVYSHPHIGNARPAVVFDVLFRVLRRHYGVVYARNITDVDDKINAAAAEAGVPITAVSDRYTAIYHHDMEALGVLPPTLEPRATDHIDGMIAMVERLIERGHAYEVESHVLFHVPSFAAYGRLSGRAREDMIAGARVEVAPYKRDPADFVLWKPSTDDLPGWDSPWGRGRPGWHLECSCMIEAHLGQTIDIHGGGQDLVFPHHENEIAQSTCAHGGKLFCRHWVHNGFVNVDQEKMSKSLGNVLLVRDLLEQAPGETVRAALLSAHYRKPLDWTTQTLPRAQRSLDRLYGTLRDLGDVAPAPDTAPPPAVMAALEDDLNTPQAFAELHELTRAANAAADSAERARYKAQLLAAGEVLGLLGQKPDEWFERRGDAQIEIDEIERLIAARGAARSAKDFATADRIRDELLERGVALEDGAQGTRWRFTGAGGGDDA